MSFSGLPKHPTGLTRVKEEEEKKKPMPPPPLRPVSGLARAILGTCSDKRRRHRGMVGSLGPSQAGQRKPPPPPPPRGEEGREAVAPSSAAYSGGRGLRSISAARPPTLQYCRRRAYRKGLRRGEVAVPGRAASPPCGRDSWKREAEKDVTR